jgi:hypothetical protein
MKIYAVTSFKDVAIAKIINCTAAKDHHSGKRTFPESDNTRSVA